MSYDSLPADQKAPTFEDVVAYATEADLFGKLDLSRFYDYYAKQNFMYRGILMDWKSKMHEWAKNQRAKVIINAREYEAQAKVKKSIPKYQGPTTKEIWDRVAMI